MIMYAYKDNDGNFDFIFRTEIQVKMCFPNMKSIKGNIVKVNVEEVKK